MFKLFNLKKFFTEEFKFYRNIIFHKKTPLVTKLILAAAVIYVLVPFDLLPDFVPFPGFIDDLIIAPALLKLSLIFVPEDIKKECETKEKK